jgi:hypothetical protein
MSTIGYRYDEFNQISTRYWCRDQGATHPNDASPSDMALSPILITADIDQVLDDLSDEKEERS